MQQGTVIILVKQIIPGWNFVADRKILRGGKRDDIGFVSELDSVRCKLLFDILLCLYLINLKKLNWTKYVQITCQKFVNILIHKCMFLSIKKSSSYSQRISTTDVAVAVAMAVTE